MNFILLAFDLRLDGFGLTNVESFDYQPFSSLATLRKRISTFFKPSDKNYNNRRFRPWWRLYKQCYGGAIAGLSKVPDILH